MHPRAPHQPRSCGWALWRRVGAAEAAAHTRPCGLPRHVQAAMTPDTVLVTVMHRWAEPCLRTLAARRAGCACIALAAHLGDGAIAAHLGDGAMHTCYALQQQRGRGHLAHRRRRGSSPPPRASPHRRGPKLREGPFGREGAGGGVHDDRWTQAGGAQGAAGRPAPCVPGPKACTSVHEPHSTQLLLLCTAGHCGAVHQARREAAQLPARRRAGAREEGRHRERAAGCEWALMACQPVEQAAVAAVRWQQCSSSGGSWVCRNQAWRNAALQVGLGAAAEVARREGAALSAHMAAMRDRLATALLAGLPEVRAASCCQHGLAAHGSRSLLQHTDALRTRLLAGQGEWAVTP